MLPLHIGLSGRAGCGKDTVARILDEYGYTARAFAGPLKQALAVLGLPEPETREAKEALLPGKNYSYRQAAQTLGTEWARNLDPNFWVNLAIKDVNTPLVFTDIRFEEEARAVRNLGGVIWHIIGRASDLGVRGSHASENGIMLYPQTDELLDNSGSLMQLRENVRKLLKGQ